MKNGDDLGELICTKCNKKYKESELVKNTESNFSDFEKMFGEEKENKTNNKVANEDILSKFDDLAKTLDDKKPAQNKVNFSTKTKVNEEAQKPKLSNMAVQKNITGQNKSNSTANTEIPVDPVVNKVEQKVEQKVDQKVEQKVEPKVEPEVEPEVEQKVETKVEQKTKKKEKKVKLTKEEKKQAKENDKLAKLEAKNKAKEEKKQNKGKSKKQIAKEEEERAAALLTQIKKEEAQKEAEAKEAEAKTEKELEAKRSVSYEQVLVLCREQLEKDPKNVGGFFTVLNKQIANHKELTSNEINKIFKSLHNSFPSNLVSSYTSSYNNIIRKYIDAEQKNQKTKQIVGLHDNGKRELRIHYSTFIKDKYFPKTYNKITSLYNDSLEEVVKINDASQFSTRFTTI